MHQHQQFLSLKEEDYNTLGKITFENDEKDQPLFIGGSLND